MWLEGFQVALNSSNLLWLLMGSAIGLVVGVLPGLGPTFGVALMMPFTFSLDPATGLIFLCAIHAACNYGDSFSSIMLNVPGGPGTVASCWDGYPMAKQGFAGRALGIATLSSLIGGGAAWLSLMLIARPITDFAMRLGAPEYFALGLMALGLISIGSKGETIKGLLLACLGLALSFVGEDPITGLTRRFSFGIPWMEAGIPIVVSTLGVFAVSQVIVMLGSGGSIAGVIEMKDSVLSGFGDVVKRPLTLLRSGALGWFIGILPALGVSLAGITTYLFEKKYSPVADNFGKGEPSGLIAAEVGKGACVIGDLIPTFTLGVPGSVTGAILMAALIIHGVEPGPRFLTSGVMPWTVFAGLLLAQLLFIPAGLLFGKWLAKIVYLPNALLAPVIMVLCFLGAYAERNYTFDLLLMVALGFVAYGLERMGYPIVCLVLGLILGPLIETNFHRAIGIGLGSYSVFVERPIAFTLLVITAVFLLWPFIADLASKSLHRSVVQSEAADSESKSDEQVSWSQMVVLLGLGAVLAVFLWDAQRYGPAVSLFPKIVSTVGLVLVALLLVSMGLSAKRKGWLKSSTVAPLVRLFSGALDWRWSVGMMVLYIVLVYAVGFALASGVYVVAMAWMMGYRRRWLTAGTGALVIVVVIAFARLLGIILPLGLLAG